LTDSLNSPVNSPVNNSVDNSLVGSQAVDDALVGSGAVDNASSRELELVELVDEAGRPTGSSTVDEAHREPGRLHRAFSVLLLDPSGRALLQQRAAVKTRFPLRWANACCGHPRPGEAVTTAGSRRLGEELGVRDVELTEIGVYAYRAADPVTGRVEHEYDHVLLGRIEADHPVHPDPAEVAALRWVMPDDLATALSAEPQTYAPWLAGVVAQLRRTNGSSSRGSFPGARERSGGG
jgi:isopentenyl-diphosphate delta-isomerase